MEVQSHENIIIEKLALKNTSCIHTAKIGNGSSPLFNSECTVNAQLYTASWPRGAFFIFNKRESHEPSSISS